MAGITTVGLSGNEYIDAILWGNSVDGVWRWESGAPTTEIHYFFSSQAYDFGGDLVGGAAWRDFEKAAYSLALDTWVAVADITFTQVFSIGAADLVEVLDTAANVDALGFHETPETAAFFGQAGGAYSYQGRGWTASGLAQGGYGFITLIHELGHALGLAHPHDDGGHDPGEGGPKTFPGVPLYNDAAYGLFSLNQGIYTTMSYNDGWDRVQNPNGRNINAYGYQAAPMAFDIAAIQHLYGANLTVHTGDDVYVLPDANAAGTFWLSIWDTGGTDTIAYNGARGSVIDLRPATLDRSSTGGGALSFASGILGGFTIAADFTNALPDVNGVTGVVIENATGGSGADRITGNDAGNELSGNAGGDRISGLGGFDLVSGGTGSDTLDGGAGDDTIAGGSGNDRLAGGEGADVLDTGEGLDTALGGNGDDTIGAGASLLGKRLYGEAGDDLLTGAAGRDVLDGGSGDDALAGGLENDTLLGGTGADTALGEDGLDVLRGGDGDDRLDGGAQGDRLFGDGGDDSLEGGSGGDLLDGGNDEDRLLGGGDGDTLRGGNGEDDLAGEEGNDVLDGGAGQDLLAGGDGNDTLSGGLGSDLLLADQGLDVLSGGAGADLLIVTNAGGFDRIAGFSLSDDVIDLSEFGFADLGALLAASTDTAAGLVIALDGDDQLTLTGIRKVQLLADDFILAGQSGDASAETLSGTAAGEAFRGGDGNDTIVAGAGRDFVMGEDGDDSLDGGSEGDTILGGDGNDAISGGEGADLLGGGEGGDTILGGAGNDTVGGFAGSDSLDGEEGDDLVSGHAGNDTLTGGLGNDTLAGGAGDDLIRAGLGNDIASGGLGSDIFEIVGGGGITRITDFSRLDDVIDLTDFGFASLAQLKAAAVDTSQGLLVTLDADDRLILSGIKEVQLAADDFVFV